MIAKYSIDSQVDLEELTKYSSSILQSTLHALDFKSITGISAILASRFKHNSKLILIGVGKNAILCQKIAATFKSLHLPAYALDVTHAVHGDLGIVSDNDIIMSFSKSGTTQELADLLHYIKNSDNIDLHNVPVISVNCTHDELPNSDITLNVNHKFELDAHDLVPTLSLLAMQYVADLIAIQVATYAGLTKNDFISTHPGGAIGKTK